MQYSIIVTILWTYISLIHGCANDILALRALYSQLGGQHWRKNTGWNTTTPCPAYGVTCNTDGCVTALSLDSNNLQGSLPTEIGFLQRLQNLSVASNSIIGPIPTEIGNLQSLAFLRISSTYLSGPLPTQLGMVINIQRLLLRSNAITGTLPSELGMLTQARTIELQSNQLVGTIPSELFRLPGLTALFLQSNLLSGVIPEDANQLSFLNVQENCISGSLPDSLCLSKTLLVGNFSNNNMTCAGCNISAQRVFSCIPTAPQLYTDCSRAIPPLYTSPDCPCPDVNTTNGNCLDAQVLADCVYSSPDRCSGIDNINTICQSAKESLCPSLRCGLIPEPIPKVETPVTKKKNLPLSVILPLSIAIPALLVGAAAGALACRRKKKATVKQWTPVIPIATTKHSMHGDLDGETTFSLSQGTVMLDDSGPGKMILFDTATNEEYTISGKILGKGGAGVVYLGMDKRGHLMAFKNIWTNAEMSKEAIIMKELKHKNLVQLKALARSKEGSEYLVMEFMSGGSLSEQIKDFENFNKIQVKRFLHDILSGVQFLHDHCVVHRDIKPSNILLAADGTAKVADFGISKFDYDFTNQPGSLVGTIRYLAPEVVAGESASAKADIWAIGLLTIEMATGEKPWPHLMSDVHVCTTLATFAGDTYTLPLSIRDDELIDFLQKCLHTRPDKRSTAQELLLHPFVTSTTTQ